MDSNKGRGIFYGVIGVATLIIAIIGATFAYFSANATLSQDSDNIAGSSNNALAGALTLKVTRVNKTVTTANSLDLVPTNITASTSSITTAVAAHCEASGYTGCHLYKIEASTTQDVAAASINLDSLSTTATVKTDWHYAIYTGTDSSATALVTGGNGTFDLSSSFDMHDGAALTATSGATYYLLIWIADDSSEQNASDANDSTGSYTGAVTMNAGSSGGQVSATFGA